MIQQIQSFPCACGCGREVPQHDGRGRPSKYATNACKTRACRQQGNSVTKIKMDVTKIRNTIIQGDVLDVLAHIPDGIVQCCVTSPPYWNLRDYGVLGQIGLERTPQAYVEKLVSVFREVHRVLRDDGVLWLNIGDSYTGSGKGGGGSYENDGMTHATGTSRTKSPGFKPKNLIGIPWRVAMALQDDGWILRSDVIWHKLNAMPESVEDRPTSAHEHLFLLAKSERYFYNAATIREPAKEWAGAAGTFARSHGKNTLVTVPGQTYASHRDNREDRVPPGRNKRNVWSIASQPYSGAHFATMPPKLVEPCILAGSALQACEHCGAPWKSVIVKGPKAPEPTDRHPNKRLAPGQSGHADEGNMGFRASRLSGQEMAAWRVLHPDRCEGDQPTCSCQETGGSGKSLVLDPFAGSGTVLAVASQLGRQYLGIELNPDYIGLAHDRLNSVQPSLWYQNA